ncbi:hypothetical protein MAJ_06768, partial [Metarhizium majus ARSEF 297]
MDWNITTILQLAFSVFIFLFLLSSLFIAALGRRDARKSTVSRAFTLVFAIGAAVTSHFWRRANGQFESETQLISTLTVWNSAASFVAWPLTSESSRCSGVAVVAITVTTIVFGRFHSSLACVVAMCGSNVLVWWTTCAPTVALSCYVSLRILAFNVVKRKMPQRGLVSDPEAPPSAAPGHHCSTSEPLQDSGTQLQQFQPPQNQRPPSAGSKLTAPSLHEPAAVPAGPLDPSPRSPLENSTGLSK